MIRRYGFGLVAAAAASMMSPVFVARSQDYKEADRKRREMEDAVKMPIDVVEQRRGKRARRRIAARNKQRGRQ